MLKIKKLHPAAKLPHKSRLSDAGYDLYSIEQVQIPPGRHVLIRTGIAMEIPTSRVGLIWDRSSMGVNGIHRLAGVIDPSYRGEIRICLANLTQTSYEVEIGDKIAQIIFQDYCEFLVQEVNELSETDRGAAGFGSSGK